MLTEEEVQALQEEKKKTEEALQAKQKEAEEAAEKATKLEEDLKAKLEELEKLRTKDMNFKKFRDLTETEREKLTAKDRELMLRQESVEEEARKLKEQQTSFYKRNAIAQVSAGDETFAKAIEAAYAEFAGSADDQSAVEARVLKAARLVKGEKAAPNLVTASFAQVGTPPVSPNQQRTSYADTEEGKAVAARLGLKLEAKK